MNEEIKFKLSANIRWFRFVVLGGILFFLFHFISKLSSEEDLRVEDMVGLSIVTVIFSITYFLLDRAKTVTYDSFHLYINGKKGVEEIPLKKVDTVQMTGIKLNGKNMYSIHYQDQFSNRKYVTFLPKWFNGNMELFQETVRKANRSAKIRNWSIG